MKAVIKRIRILEERVTQRKAQGPAPVDVLRQRLCRRQAEATGRPYEELLREDEMKAKAFWESYDGDRSLAGILRSRYPRRPLAQPAQIGNP